MKILVVDDSRTIRAGMANLIGRMGHTVIEAENGEEALRLFAEEQPELVLIDVMMPVMDGYEAAKRMRQSQGDDWVPIIFLSSMEADQDLDRAIDAGGDDYLVKPVSFVVLNAKIRALHRTESVRRKLVEASGTLVTLNKELENLSRHDGLTELANRRYLDESLLTEVRRAARARATVFHSLRCRPFQGLQRPLRAPGGGHLPQAGCDGLAVGSAASRRSRGALWRRGICHGPAGDPA